ncbi:HDOD domain-containing protein [Marinomonas algarum]|uniref:HDOD domain-containing protein n=1 Tax=Marinomonas algarum TaxID=2883105 RepID=A0A9X1LEN3_9GAMM|nr:HDOD domain-containing protein [Marinomonas algarum]MCB5161728.1 HDOD domain-containing protein [Marinomonas algarum]
METTVNSPLSERVCVVHLADSIGRLRVIFPKNHMLDLAAIARVTKRRFEPVPYYSRASDLLIKPNSMYTLLATSLLELPRLLIQVHTNGTQQEITSAELQQLFSGPLNRFERISVPTQNIKRPVEHHDQDAEQILQGLGRFQSIRLKKRIEETVEMPPLPASSHQVIRLSNSKTASINELCDIITLDPSLTAQVISWASSPYYRAPGGITTIEDAIIRVLGFDMVMNLALGLSLSNAFTLAKDNLHHYENFWLESVSGAVLTEALAKCMPVEKQPKKGHAYLAGLLHNFGYLAIGTILPPHFSILTRYQEANAHLCSELIEMQMMHFTREQMGAWLLRHWNLPEPIWTAIRYSKRDEYQGEHAMLAHLLYISHRLLHHDSISEAVLKRVGLTLEQAERCREALYQESTELKKVVASMNKINT